MAEKFPRDPENGCLIGPDGCHYDTEQDVYHFAVLGLCGCGRPDEAYNFVRDVLAKLDRRGDGPWINAEDAIALDIDANPKMAAHAILHLLANLNVMEHGGSVGGSWLNDMGHAIVDAGPRVEKE
jgi:hypothetical protein